MIFEGSGAVKSMRSPFCYKVLVRAGVITKVVALCVPVDRSIGL